MVQRGCRLPRQLIELQLLFIRRARLCALTQNLSGSLKVVINATYDWHYKSIHIQIIHRKRFPTEKRHRSTLVKLSKMVMLGMGPLVLHGRIRDACLA